MSTTAFRALSAFRRTVVLSANSRNLAGTRSISYSYTCRSAGSSKTSEAETAAEATAEPLTGQDATAKNEETASASENAKDAGEEPLPLLQRPLGVHERPTSERKTWAQTRDELMDQEKRLHKRKQLVREATKGYFTDLNATRRHGGKTWIAPRVMIREDKALYFPDIVGTNLSSKAEVHTTSLCVGKVSVIAMLSTRISELQTANFINPTHTEFSSHPAYQYIQINLQENLLKSLLVSLFASSIRKSVPEELWDKYLISSQNMDYIREDLGMANRHVGYVYLVDEACRVRWAGCADPMPQEVDALKLCTTVLLKRHAKKAEST